MIVGYARVSTDDQDARMQIDALKAAGATKIFSDVASGVLNRPELQAALDYVRDGDTFVVWRLDRLARSSRDLLDTVYSLQSRDVRIKSLKESIDTTTSSGRLFLQIMAALAEFERESLKERINAGLIAARERGIVGGRRNVLSKKDERQALEMYYDKERTYTVQDIATVLRVTRQTIYNYLARHKELKKQKGSQKE